MPGAYTRSKLAAEQLALKAAASGLPIVIANPTMPIGVTDSLTPPILMLQYFVHRRVHFYLDFVLNLVDVRDVAAGFSRNATRADRTALRSERRKFLSKETSRAYSSDEWAQNAAHPVWDSPNRSRCGRMFRRSPDPSATSATLEGVRVALWSKPVSIEKSRQELGYEPGLISVLWKKLCHRFWSIALGDYRKDADEQACAIAEPSAITAEQRAIGFANDLISVVSQR
jgi:dihydroflavonol-4-reductase